MYEKPDGYDEKKVNTLLDENKKEEEINMPPTNVIAIMSEAFFDGHKCENVLFKKGKNPYEKYNILKKEALYGEIVVPGFAGGTSSTEFEFLTGHTMDYFPVGSIPYQQYIKEETPSMAKQLADLGYVTYGIHPYNASGWNRDTVYPNLGFSESYFLTDFTKRQYNLCIKYKHHITAQIYSKGQAGKPVWPLWKSGAFPSIPWPSSS